MGGHHQDTYGTEPATLYKVMQETIGFGLQQRYQPDKEIPHDLLVIMMQINETDARERNES
ncbi:MAG TPA: hypothetical protein VE224_11205 [Pseudolabrys sp.]|nr:hypothetical protein [Pseudolabrys sp.]